MPRVASDGSVDLIAAQQPGGRRRYEQRKRAQKTEATRGRILAAAYELLMTHTYDEVTLTAVADRAGVTVPTVLSHFGSKEGLLREGAVAWQQQEQDQREVPQGDIDAIARVLAHRYEQTGEMMNRYVALSQQLPLITELIEESRRSHASWLERMFARELPRKGQVRRRRVAQLFAATEIYCWTSWRNSLGLSAREAERALAEHLNALVMSWRNEDREGH